MTPPRLASRLLDRVLPPGPEGDTIRGDLLEEYSRRARRSRAAAAAWYWREACSLRLRYRAPRPFFVSARRQSLAAALSQDVRYAARMLRKSHAFTAIVVTTLALGIGANTAIFSALDAVLLQPLPYPNADRLVHLTAFNPTLGITDSSVSAADFLDWRRDVNAFEQLAAYAPFSTSIRGAGPDAQAERISSAVEDNLFATLGIAPSIGRDFRGEDAHARTATAAVLSSGLWQRQFGGANVLGTPLKPGASTTIVGILPRGVAYPDGVELWVPAVLDPSTDPRDNRSFDSIALLKRDATVREAQAQLDAVSARLEAAFPVTNRGWRVRAVPLLDYVVGPSKRTLLLLLGAVALVMLIACANVAGLFVAQAVARQREIAVRAAIGAARGRIFRQVVTESTLLSLTGGALGLAVGYWILQLLIAMGAGGIPRLEQARLDRTVLLFCVAISLLTGIAFGLLPALHLSRTSLVGALREGSRGAGSRSRTRSVLVVVEVALAVVLLVSAGLLARSFETLQRVDVGFNPRNLLTMRVALSGAKYRDTGTQVAFFEEAVRRIAAIPGVRSAAAALSLPVGGGGFYLGRGFILPGRPHPSEGYTAGFQVVTPGYFAALETPLLRGRDFDARDSASAPPVAIVNRALADRLFPNQDPLGQKLLVWRDEQTPREIVGVVGDLKPADLTAASGNEIFVPQMQSPMSALTFVIRTAGPPANAAAPVRAALRDLDPAQPTYAVKTMDSVMHDALAQQRFSLVLFAGFAALSLALVAVGLYGVMTHAVAARKHEMGVRMALGARPSEVRRLVVRQGALLLGAGLALGVPAAMGAARLLGTLLYDVSPSDPITAAFVVGTIAFVTFISAYVPARRSTRVDPASVLRSD